jgi:hypothetical protein
MLRVTRLLCCAAVAIFLMSAAGCASFGQFRPQTVEDRGPKGWWYASFKIDWQQEGPLWHVDLLIAHRVAAPVIEKYKGTVALWRFHRRAAHDAAGHRFSFIFYSSAATANKVYREIEANAVLADMKSKGLILETSFDDTSKITRPGIGGTSDTAWSVNLQNSWPYFIMGVSQTWLDLISWFAEDGRKKPVTLDETLDFYKEINEAVENTWQKEGAHAFLHHLNAIFGYEPLFMGRQGQMRF